MVIDARGRVVRKPVMMAEEALLKITEGIVEVIVTMRHSRQSCIVRKSNALFSETIRDSKDWRVEDS